ncbi:MAG: HAD family phosphatase [Candidatus Eremiobacteraeota bacterium]|nr:HAD family phosphatase [Candidatus Eremiobacteraeota bacterium]MBC5826564.1 HAD family phosphatase [Candidatus Eremiobacteraeota bacterium]
MPLGNAAPPRLIAVDLDGTLLDDRGRISQRNKAAIAAVRRRNCDVVIVTYRAYLSSKPYARELGLHLPLLCCNGALVKDATDDHVLESFPLTRAAATAAVEYGMANGFEQCLYIGEHYIGHPAIVNKYGEQWRFQWEECDDLRERLHEPTLMVRYFIDEHVGARVARDLDHLGVEHVADRFGDSVQVTLMQKGVSKRSALERFARDLGIERRDVIALGDGALDAGMLAYAGHGIAMANAHPAALAAADEVTSSNEDDGVAIALERLFALSPPTNR